MRFRGGASSRGRTGTGAVDAGGARPVSNLVAEILLRLAKALAAALIGLLFYVLAVGPMAAAPSAELVLLAWIAGVAFVLVVQESPL